MAHVRLVHSQEGSQERMRPELPLEIETGYLGRSSSETLLKTVWPTVREESPRAFSQRPEHGYKTGPEERGLVVQLETCQLFLLHWGT